MSGIIDHVSNNDRTYSHAIIGQKCCAQLYSATESDVKVVFPGTFIEVHSVRDDNVFFCIVNDDMETDPNQLICRKSDIIRVPENLWGPLFTVKRAARLPLVEDKSIAESLANISVGDTVVVLGQNNTSVCIANVTFRNSISRLGVGVFFGLQVLSSKESLQTLIKKISLLEPSTKGFPRGCDIVVTIDKICLLSKDKSSSQCEREIGKNPVKSIIIAEDVSNLNLKEKFANTSKKSLPSNGTAIECSVSSSKKINNYENLPAIGDMVVYLNGNVPEKGIVKWIGKIKNSLKIGVEFENPIGNESGIVDGNEFFSAKYGHSLFLPPKELMKLSDYMMNNIKENIQFKNNYNNSSVNNINNNNNTNINNNYNNNSNNYNSLRVNDLCCEGKNKMFKITLNSHQCLKYPGKLLSCTDSVQQKNSEDVFQNYIALKGDHPFDLPLHHDTKSFNNIKSNEKKKSCRRDFVFMDNDLIHNTDTKTQRIPSQDLYNAMGPSFLKTEYSVKKKSTQDSDDMFLPCKSTLTYQFGNKSKECKEKDICDFQYSEHSSSNESLSHYYDTPKPSGTEELGKGSVVELTYKNEPHYGVIRWVGTIPDDKDIPHLIAGVEMEEEMDGFTDGTFHNRRYFECNPRKALFVPLSKCRKDSRFSEDPQKQNVSSKINYGQIDCPIVEGIIAPINKRGNIESICGKNRGIQGHHNSCYLDATLFSMFAFTSVFDSLLYRPPTKHDIPQYNEVQRVLRDEIVNPLRKNLYVRADRVMKLRTLLEKLSSVSGLTSEEKDPEEFLNSLLAQILKAEPFLKLSSGQEAFHYQLFVEKDERLVFPSVQQLFEQSFLTSDIKLKQIPSCLIIQMPRFGKSFKMYSQILPPQLLDVTDIIENSPRQCTVCGKLAEYECKDCFGQQGIGNGLESISFCKGCLETAHNHHCRTRHNCRSLTVPVEFYELQEHCIIPRLYLELFAVVCIETSHYVAFVKCGSGSDAPWCFFDSMADRKGEQNGYNIPEMVPCPDLPYWLSEDGAKMVSEMGDDRQLPEHAKRLFSDAYMCMYQSPDLMMYR